MILADSSLNPGAGDRLGREPLSGLPEYLEEVRIPARFSQSLSDYPYDAVVIVIGPPLWYHLLC